MNKKEKQKNAFNDLFEGIVEPIEYKEEVIIEKESIENSDNTKVKTTSEKTKNKIIRKKRNYYIPIDILEDIDKIVYMDRDLKDNTELVIRALRKYLDSKTCKDLLEEYNNLKGGKVNK